MASRKGELPSLGGDDLDAGANAEATKVQSREAGQQAPPQTRMQTPHFIVLTGPHAGQMYRAAEGDPFVIGRAPDAGIRLSDDGISRRHARVVVNDGRATIEDMESANGTLLNGAELTAMTVLKDGDKIQLGSTTILKFSAPDDMEEQFQRKLFEAAQRDALTHAYNRRVFNQQLTIEFGFAQRHRGKLALLLFDIDHFKKVNDTHGHPAGDAVLVVVAKTVANSLRAEDFFARYGGEEFVVLCRETSRDGALSLAERIRASVGAAVTSHEDVTIRCTVSVGIGLVPDPTIGGPEQLVAVADAALYAAKEGGRNRVVCRQASGE